jgi:hypothetical protein
MEPANVVNANAKKQPMDNIPDSSAKIVQLALTNVRSYNPAFNANNLDPGLI